MADTVVYQSKQKLKETQSQLLKQCGHHFLKMQHTLRDEV